MSRFEMSRDYPKIWGQNCQKIVILRHISALFGPKTRQKRSLEVSVYHGSHIKRFTWPQANITSYVNWEQSLGISKRDIYRETPCIIIIFHLLIGITKFNLQQLHNLHHGIMSSVAASHRHHDIANPFELNDADFWIYSRFGSKDKW